LNFLCGVFFYNRKEPVETAATHTTRSPRLQQLFVINFDTKIFAKKPFPSPRKSSLKNAGCKSANQAVPFLHRSGLHFLPQHIFKQLF